MVTGNGNYVALLWSAKVSTGRGGTADRLEYNLVLGKSAADIGARADPLVVRLAPSIAPGCNALALPPNMREFGEDAMAKLAVFAMLAFAMFGARAQSPSPANCGRASNANGIKGPARASKWSAKCDEH